MAIVLGITPVNSRISQSAKRSQRGHFCLLPSRKPLETFSVVTAWGRGMVVLLASWGSVDAAR